MDRAETYARWIVENADKKGTPEFDTVVQAYQAAKGPEIPWQGRALQNLVAGGVRGAGSIGATLLTPIDSAARALGVQNSWIGRDDRREAMTQGLASMGADTDSLAFKTGKLGAEIAGTAGVGGALAKAVPAALPAAPQVANALRTFGMTTGAPGGLGIRALGGAASGGAAAGLIDPQDAGAGAVIGGAMPVAIKGAGMAGNALGRALSGPPVPQAITDAARAGQAAGYVIPPASVKPTLTNRLLEGMSGKLTMQQNASARNQAVTNAKAATALGLPPDLPLTPDLLANVRANAGNAYQSVASAGTVTPGQAYDAALDAIAAPFKKAAAGFPNAKANPIIQEIDSLRTGQFDAASAVEKIKELRNSADIAYRQGDKNLGKAYKSASKAIEDAIDRHLVSIGAPSDVLQNFRQARELIAKTYTVEAALNPTTGTVNAARLAKDLEKGKPLAGDLLDIARFSAAFPKATQPIERMGSLPQLSPLDWMAGGGLAAATSNPLMLAAMGARPAARMAGLSGPVQRGLLSPGGGPFLNPELETLLYRSAPALAANL